MAKQYTEVGRYPSKSSPGKEYIVSVDENGDLSCDCRGWTMKKAAQERTCPHVREAAAGNIPAAASTPPPSASTPINNSGQGGSLAEMLREVRKAKGEEV